MYLHVAQLVVSYPSCQQLATAYSYYYCLCVRRRNGFSGETTAFIPIAKLGRGERVDTTPFKLDSCHWTRLSSSCAPVVLKQLF
jgi:hypothetical protein